MEATEVFFMKGSLYFSFRGFAESENVSDGSFGFGEKMHIIKVEILNI